MGASRRNPCFESRRLTRTERFVLLLFCLPDPGSRDRLSMLAGLLCFAYEAVDGLRSEMWLNLTLNAL